MKIVPFDSDNPGHAAFVMNAVRKRQYDWPYTPSDEDWLVDVARKTIVGNPRGCVLGVDDRDEDLLYGYVLTEPGVLTMAYTKQALRGPGAFDAPPGTPRDPGCPPVCSTLLDAVGIDPSKPTAVRIWSTSASRIAARGWHLFPAIPHM